MKKTFLNIKNWLYLLWTGLFWGLKSTDKEAFTQSGVDMGGGISMDEEMHTNRISHDLLAGKETQAVKELRYRTYKVDRESKMYEYFSPTLALKREEKLDSKFVKFENEENLNIITVQNNFPLTEGVLETLRQVDGQRHKIEYWIKLIREKGFLPRYRLEEYTKRIVVREYEKDVKAVLDFYVTKYPNDKDLKSKGFVREIEHVMNDGLRSDVLQIKNVSFVTCHAFNQYDMILFEFNNLQYRYVKEFDGHYVISFLSDIVKNGEDLTDKFKNQAMEEKYNKKERKDVVYELTTDMLKQTFYCADCGKAIEYDPMAIDEMEPSANPTGTNNTAYFDLQMAEQTFGKKLCTDCLKKYMINKEEIKSIIKKETDEHQTNS